MRLLAAQRADCRNDCWGKVAEVRKTSGNITYLGSCQVKRIICDFCCCFKYVTEKKMKDFLSSCQFSHLVLPFAHSHLMRDAACGCTLYSVLNSQSWNRLLCLLLSSDYVLVTKADGLVYPRLVIHRSLDFLGIHDLSSELFHLSF